MKRTAPEHCELLARGNDQLHAGFLTQNAAVEAQIIVLRLSPVAACVILVVDAALLVLFRQALLRRLVLFLFRRSRYNQLVILILD